MTSFGARMKAARERLGMTQRELATATDIDAMQISRWERGPRTPQNQDELIRLAETLGVTIDHLVRGTAPTSNARWTADEIRAWPVVPLLVELMAGEEPTDEELVEVVKVSAYHRGSDGDADMRLVTGMRDAIRSMRTAMTPEQARASAEATARHTDPNVPRRRKR